MAAYLWEATLLEGGWCVTGKQNRKRFVFVTTSISIIPASCGRPTTNKPSSTWAPSQKGTPLRATNRLALDCVGAWGGASRATIKSRPRSHGLPQAPSPRASTSTALKGHLPGLAFPNRRLYLESKERTRAEASWSKRVTPWTPRYDSVTG